jgi:zinc protease
VNRARLLSFLAAGLIVTSAHALPPIQSFELDNGARVLFVEAHELAMVQLNIAFDAGAARDPRARRGLARLTNGLLDEGAGGMSSDEIARNLEETGAELGNESGRDFARFELRSLSDPALLGRAAKVLAEILARPDFPTDALERERQRVLVALARDEQSPAEVGERRFFSLLYGSHPYANPPEGEAAAIRSLTRDELAEFHRRHYVGANAVAAIVGDLTAEQARALAQLVLGGLARGEPAPALPPVPPVGSGAEDRIGFPSQQTHVYLGQPGTTREDPDYFALYVGNHVLGGGGLVSRLSNEIREARGLAYSVYSYFQPMRQPGPFLINLQTRNDQANQAVEVTRATIGRFVSDGPAAEELEAAKRNLTGGFALALDSNRKIAGQLLNIGFYRLPLDYLDNYVRRVEAVTVEDVRAAFRRRVSPTHLVEVTVGGN